VGVPMFPSLVSREQAIKGILLALGLLLGSSYLLVLWADSVWYLVGVSALNLVLVVAGVRLYRSESNRAGWVLFKLTSPYIILVFLIFMFSQYLV
jgi:heme O synthase-like polyprenyltransferase